MKCPTSPLLGQGGDLPLGRTNSPPPGPKNLANFLLLCILFRYYNLKKYAKAPPLRPCDVVKRHTNPLSLEGWGGAFH